MSKKDSPEDTLAILCMTSLLVYYEADSWGWSWDYNTLKEVRGYETDADIKIDVAKRTMFLFPFPGREKRVMQWIAKGKLMIPHFNAVLGEVYIDGTEVLD